LITDPAFYAVAIPAVLLSGIAKAGANGLGILAVPLMALAVSPAVAAAVLLPILCAMDLLGLWAWRGRAHWSVLRTVLPGAMLGIVAGSLVFFTLDVRWVKIILGAESILFALHRIVAHRAIAARPARSPSHLLGGFWGGIGGFTSTLAHAGSPPLMQYLLPLKLDRDTLVATSVIFFTVVNAVKLVPYGLLGLLDASGLATALALAPAIPVGYWIGLRAVRALPEHWFQQVVVWSLLLIGIKLLWDGIAGRLADA